MDVFLENRDDATDWLSYTQHSDRVTHYVSDKKRNIENRYHHSHL